MIIRISIWVVFVLVGSGKSFSQYSDFKYKKRNHSTDAGYLKASKQTRYFSGGLGFNLNTYFGDLTPNQKYIKNALKVTRPGVVVFANYNFNSHLFFSGDLSYARIIGDDFNSDPHHSSISARKYVRNLSFRNDIIGLTIRANANLLRDPFEYFKRRDYNLYFFSGLSFYYSNPKSKVPEKAVDGTPFENAGKWVALRALGTEGQNHPDIGNKYNAIQLGIPFGVGFRYRIRHRIDLLAECTLSYLLSDYIDDVGGDYVDLGVFEDEVAKSLSDRSREENAALKRELRDWQAILESTEEFTYESIFDGNSYTVFDGFGHEGAIRGGDKNDIIASLSIKISYIFTK
ncbi:MAG: hypothetical protein MI975_24410 [Cytophagales bacterium]|nr:hypothetical protein [Cytophagales bacterium]